LSYEEGLGAEGRGSGLSVVLSSAMGGAPLDPMAAAFDVAMPGFKLDTQAKLSEGLAVAFVMELPGGERVTGQGRVMWANNEPFGTWAGIKIVKMSWSDKRRLSRMLFPDQFDWAHLADLAMKALVVLTVIAAANKLLHRPYLLAMLERLLPQCIALMLMGWALLGLLQRERR
jgi:hypothetical protein